LVDVAVAAGIPSAVATFCVVERWQGGVVDAAVKTANRR